MNSKHSWMDDPALAKIDFKKLDFLQQMLFQSKQYNGKELFPFFMSLAMKSKSQNITFSEEEMNIIIPVLKKYASEEELKKMDQLIKFFQSKK